MAKKFNDPSIATITGLNDANMMSTFDASTGKLSKITIADLRASLVKVDDDYADDIDAASGGVPVGGLYHTEGIVKLRIS